MLLLLLLLLVLDHHQNDNFINIGIMLVCVIICLNNLWYNNNNNGQLNFIFFIIKETCRRFYETHKFILFFFTSLLYEKPLISHSYYIALFTNTYTPLYSLYITTTTQAHTNTQQSVARLFTLLPLLLAASERTFKSGPGFFFLASTID